MNICGILYTIVKKTIHKIDILALLTVLNEAALCGLITFKCHADDEQSA